MADSACLSRSQSMMPWDCPLATRLFWRLSPGEKLFYKSQGEHETDRLQSRSDRRRPCDRWFTYPSRLSSLPSCHHVSFSSNPAYHHVWFSSHLSSSPSALSSRPACPSSAPSSHPSASCLLSSCRFAFSPSLQQTTGRQTHQRTVRQSDPSNSSA